MPCCLLIVKENLEELCDDCFTVAKYLKAYSSVIHPLPNSQLDPRNDDENLKSPTLKKMHKRPRKNMRKEEGEPILRKKVFYCEM